MVGGVAESEAVEVWPVADKHTFTGCLDGSLVSNLLNGSDDAA